MNHPLSVLDVTSLASTTMFAAQNEGRRNDTPTPAPIVKGVQTLTVTVSAGKYSPSVISVKRGKPVALVFRGGKNMGCGSTIVFRSLKQKRTVKEGQTVVFKWTPTKAGVVAFACPMDMYKGKVIVK